MTRLLRCSKGHKWPDTFAPDETTAQLSTNCPVCGAAALIDGNDPANEIATHEMTLDKDSNLGASRPATKQVEHLQKSSHKTGPTVAAEKVDHDTTILPGQRRRQTIRPCPR